MNSQIAIDEDTQSFVKSHWISISVFQASIISLVYYVLSFVIGSMSVIYQVGAAVLITAILGIIASMPLLTSIKSKYYAYHSWTADLAAQAPLHVACPFRIKLLTGYTQKDLDFLPLLCTFLGAGWSAIALLTQVVARSDWAMLSSGTQSLMMIKVPLHSKEFDVNSKSYFAFSFFHELAHLSQNTENAAYSLAYAEHLNKQMLAELDADLKSFVWCKEHGYLDANCIQEYKALRTDLYLNGNPVYAGACILGAFLNPQDIDNHAGSYQAIVSLANTVLSLHHEKLVVLEKVLYAHMQHQEELEELLPYEFNQWFTV